MDKGAVMANMNNTHKVPERRWVLWDEASQRVYNDVYSSMLEDQRLFTNPKARSVPSRHWAVICRSAALWAADACQVEVMALKEKAK